MQEENFINVLNDTFQVKKEYDKSKKQLQDFSKESYLGVAANIGGFFLGWVEMCYNDGSFLMGEKAFDKDLRNPFWDNIDEKNDLVVPGKVYGKTHFADGKPEDPIYTVRLFNNKNFNTSSLAFSLTSSSYNFVIKEEYRKDAEGKEVVERFFELLYMGVPVNEAEFADYNVELENLNKSAELVIKNIFKAYKDVNSFYKETIAKNHEAMKEESTEVKTGESDTPKPETDNRVSEKE